MNLVAHCFAEHLEFIAHLFSVDQNHALMDFSGVTRIGERRIDSGRSADKRVSIPFLTVRLVAGGIVVIAYLLSPLGV